MGTAWKRAQAAMLALDEGGTPGEMAARLKSIPGPVERARAIAEAAAPADMVLLTALTHGMAPADLEQYARALTHVSGLAQRRLSVVGLKAGEVRELDISDRLRDALARWNGADGPRVVDITPGRPLPLLLDVGPDLAAPSDPPDIPDW